MSACYYIFYLIFYFFRIWCMGTIFVSFLPLSYPLPHPSNPSCVLPPSGIQDHFFILCVCMCITYGIHLVLLMYVCFVLTIWDWITHQGLFCGENGFSLSSYWLFVDLHLRVWPCEVSLIHASMATGVTVWILFRQPYDWGFMGAVVRAKRSSFTAGILVLWLP